MVQDRFGTEGCQLVFFVYGPTGKYFYGARSMVENEMEQTFSYLDQFASDRIPKLSIHQSGRVHVYHSRSVMAGPLRTLPLEEWRGEHIATVTVDNFESLVEYKRKLRTTGPEIDHVIRCDDEVESGRVVIYCNGQAPEFIYRCGLEVSMQRPGLKKPVFIGIAPVAQPPLVEGARGGVTIIAGWHPRKGIKEKQDYLYVRAM